MTEVDRLFFALWPDEAMREQLGAAATHLRQKLRPEGRWIGPHRYHLTLHFLGDYEKLPEALAQRALEAAATVRSPRFDLPIEQAGSYRNRSIPWWLGPSQPSAPLKQLWRALRDALQAHSVPYDTKLRLSPHVTVLRDATQVLAPTPVPLVNWPVDSFALIHSHLGVDSQYRILGTWPLSGDSAPPPPDAQLGLWDA
ncbi:2'-5' RNA ligase [Panacagrimonas perspica]|uniref:RNA 2',3'-cyclic phosphodiesterase n=1 Tax=Panacagrimonas perspica TaxID=381431 RepID=A0A4V3F597_9GAMM|nr:RNA 2',3'-cyclic phosphodiesterase [Panacagrimonas perspica]TDU28226.1 2'-5' RNA ligase [Panacagrimonas perspica]THD01306.1 2'-5' RNA ligase [Panacagrimonas perspica]